MEFDFYNFFSYNDILIFAKRIWFQSVGVIFFRGGGGGERFMFTLTLKKIIQCKKLLAVYCKFRAPQFLIFNEILTFFHA